MPDKRTQTAEAFARISLDLYAQDGTFEISILDPQMIDEVAAAFQRSGCRVKKHMRKYELAVSVPESLEYGPSCVDEFRDRPDERLFRAPGRKA